MKIDELVKAIQDQTLVTPELAAAIAAVKEASASVKNAASAVDTKVDDTPAPGV